MLAQSGLWVGNLHLYEEISAGHSRITVRDFCFAIENFDWDIKILHYRVGLLLLTSFT